MSERHCGDEIAWGGDDQDADKGKPPNSKPAEEAKATSVCGNGNGPDKSMGSDYWLTEAGQDEIISMSESQWRPPVIYQKVTPKKGAFYHGISLTTYAANPLMPVSSTQEEWTEIELTADSGACDNVMPKNLCEHINIKPSQLSERGIEYEVANGQTIPNLGNTRHL